MSCVIVNIVMRYFIVFFVKCILFIKDGIIGMINLIFKKVINILFKRIINIIFCFFIGFFIF